jgi:hypothetical protein
MFILSPTIQLFPNNQAWKLSQSQDGSFQMEYVKEKWSLKVTGYISSQFDSVQFQKDPSLIIKQKGKGHNLNLVGKVWKNSGVPLSFCAELGKADVPMVTPSGCLRFFVALVVHPFSDGNIYLGASLIYNQEMIGKERSYLGEFLGIIMSR